MRALLPLARELWSAALPPALCAACDERVPLGTAFCAGCAATAQRMPANDPRAMAAFVYVGAVARALARLKVERRVEIGRPLGDLLFGAIEARARVLGKVVVVPVPSHPARLADRGFNPPALLARRVARRLGAPLWPLALARTRDAPRQATLPREARIESVAGAFTVREPEHVLGRTVLLVDDVWTSGATLDACARALEKGGAESVFRAVLARAGY